MNLVRTLSLVLVASAAACSGAAADEGDSAAPLRQDSGARDAGADANTEDSADGAPDAQDGSVAGAFVDPRDGTTYATVIFGEATWLAENLAYVTPSGSFCYDDDPARCATDGRLYTFEAALTACPTGWHLPTDDDWKALEVAAGMETDQLDREGYSTPRGTDEGTRFKDPAGFGARMAGFRSGPSYDARGDRTYFWTATTRGADVWRRRIAAAEPTIFRFTNPPQGFAISVRCVTD